MAWTEHEALIKGQSQGDMRICRFCGAIYNAGIGKNKPPRNGYDGISHNLEECEEFQKRIFGV